MKFFYLYLVLFVLSLIPFFKPVPLTRSKPESQKEHFSPELHAINTMDKAELFLNGVCNKVSKEKFDTLSYIRATQMFVNEKFFHGYAEYTVRQNWIAALSGRYIWFHLSGVVIPEELMAYQEGLCNQQTMVFMALLQRKGISTRVVGLGYPTGPGHFLCEVKYNGTWHLYDVTTEPNWRLTSFPNEGIAFYKQRRKELYAVYQHIYTESQINTLLERVEYGKENEVPAKRMRLLHCVTYYLTIGVPLTLLVLALIQFKRHFRKEQETETEQLVAAACVESPVL